jgi:PEP-CTERM motif
LTNTTTAVGLISFDYGYTTIPLNQTQTSTTTLTGTLAGLVLDPYTSNTQVTTCVDNNFSGLCTFVTIGPPGTTTAGAAPITFNIAPAGTTVLSGIQDLGELTFGPGALILSTTTVLTAVPEPGTLMLLGAGLAGLVAFGRSSARE